MRGPVTALALVTVSLRGQSPRRNGNVVAGTVPATTWQRRNAPERGPSPFRCSARGLLPVGPGADLAGGGLADGGAGLGADADDGVIALGCQAGGLGLGLEDAA